MKYMCPEYDKHSDKAVIVASPNNTPVLVTNKGNKLTEINEETEVPKTTIIEKAIELYYRTYKETGKL